MSAMASNFRDVKGARRHRCYLKISFKKAQTYIFPGTLLLTSSAWRTPYSCLWSFGDFFDSQQTFHDEDYVEFSKSVQDKVIATKNDTAIIYDITTGKFGIFWMYNTLLLLLLIHQYLITISLHDF